jgi:hypothetical protein
LSNNLGIGENNNQLLIDSEKSLKIRNKLQEEEKGQDGEDEIHLEF